MGLLSSIFSVFTGGNQAKAIKQASKVQEKGFQQVQQQAGQTETNALADLDAALASALGTYGQARGELSPYTSAGTNALDAYQSVLGLSGPEAGNSVLSALTSAPGYQFGLNQGTQALERGAAARGGTYSGAQGKALTQFGQDYAGTQMGNVLDRIYQLVSGGQSAATNTASLYGNEAQAQQGTGQNKANVRLGVLGDISNAITGQSAANAGGILGAANARSQGAQNVLSTIGNVAKFAIPLLV